MSLQEIIDKLAEEAILLEPNNLNACGKMLILVESINNPELESETKSLKGLLESMILKDLEGNPPDVNDISDIVLKIQEKQREKNLENIEDAGSSEKKQPETKVVNEATEVEEPATVVKETTKTEEPAKPVESASVPAVKEIKDYKYSASELGKIITDDVDLVLDFVMEAKDHLDSIEQNMVEWEKCPDDKEIINSIFRPFHTIKGVAGFLNLSVVNHTSHQLENLLDETREGRIQLSPELSDLIFDGVDLMKKLIGSVEHAAKNGIPLEYEYNTENIIQRVSMLLNTAKSTDKSDAPVAQGPHIGEILVKDGKISEEDLQESLELQASMGSQKPLGEILVDEQKITVRDVRDAVRKQTESSRVQVENYIKVDTHKMDQLLNMVGELVIAQSMVTQNSEVLKITNQQFIRDISQLSRVTSTLQTISMSMRLVPIGATFQKMNRIVRDLAKKAGKEINLVLEGQSAEIDRNMVEELYDPLVHMIRNSCDHGIKTQAEREANGKPPIGNILLKAEHGGGNIVITITDDGDGLNRDAILSKAREKGLIGKDETPDNKTIYNMIFMAGFSTAQKVTEVSGRGVGMDVVRKTIEKLRGTVEIQSEPGKGTTFTIKLPLTTAIIDGLLILLGKETFIIPTLSVKQLVHPRKEDITTIIGKGEAIMVRGKLMPFLRLYKVLNIESKYKNSWEGVVVLVEDNGVEVAFQVDSVIGKQEVVIKSIGENMKNFHGVAGGAILGDGKVGLILDVRSVIESENLCAV